MVKAGDNYHRTATAAALATFLNGSIAPTYANLTGIPTRTAWSGVHRNFVAEQLSWKNYGNNHTIFDASASTSPDGGAVSNTNSQIAWTPTYPTLMGWNGASTYGVRVDASRVSDNTTGNSATVGGLPATSFMQYQGFTLDANSMTANRSGFTYSVNAPFTGPIVHFDAANYGLQVNSSYGGSGIAYRTRNGDIATWNPWREFITTANIGSYTGFDNLGNHTATTTLNLNNNNISNIGDIYATKDYGLGLVGVYSSTNYQNVFAMGTSWRLAANGATPGNLYGLAWTHTNVGGQSKSGLSHQLLIMEGGITKVALGSGIWTNYTSYLPFMYDTDNTGYYFDANSTSQVSTIYANNWFRAQGSSGLYFQDYGGGWHMSDGTWIRSYGGRNVYVDAQLRADGGLVSGAIGSLGGGTIHANGNIVNSAPSQGNLALTGDLPGYTVNTYPTIKTSGSYLYFSLANAFSAYVDPSGYWYAISSRSKKENFEVIDKQDILSKISQLEMYKWNSKRGNDDVKHIGPIAEDFWDKFHLGNNDSMISHVDPSGVALAGVQALDENYKSQQKQIETIQSTISDFGSVNVSSKELWINFSPAFSRSIDKDQLPTITVTSNRPGVNMYVAEKSSIGFKLVINSELPNGLNVDYIVMAHAKKIANEDIIQSGKSTEEKNNTPAHHIQDMQKFADPKKIDYNAQDAEFNAQKQIAEKVVIKNIETKGQTGPPKPINPKVIEPSLGPKIPEQLAPPSQYPTVPVPSNQVNPK